MEISVAHRSAPVNKSVIFKKIVSFTFGTEAKLKPSNWKIFTVILNMITVNSAFGNLLRIFTRETSYLKLVFFWNFFLTLYNSCLNTLMVFQLMATVQNTSEKKNFRGWWSSSNFFFFGNFKPFPNKNCFLKISRR